MPRNDSRGRFNTATTAKWAGPALCSLGIAAICYYTARGAYMFSPQPDNWVGLSYAAQTSCQALSGAWPPVLMLALASIGLATGTNERGCGPRRAGAILMVEAALALAASATGLKLYPLAAGEAAALAAALIIVHVSGKAGASDD